MNQLAKFLTGVAVGEPQTHGNLTIYPLRRPNGHQRSYLTLDEALKANVVVVKEVSEGGSVPTLVVHNTGSLPVLIVVGEELVGAKQNRVLNTTLLIPAQTELEIPVSCVERGRWSYSSRTFSSSGTAAHHSLRRMQTENVTHSLKMSASYDADQRAVWAEVDAKVAAFQSVTPTAALRDVYVQTEDRLKSYLDGLTSPEAEGILVTINGKIVGADLFDHAETLRVQWPKLARSYALDALEQQTESAAQPPAAAPQQFLDWAQNASDETYDSVGLGKDVRLTSDRVTGSGLLWEGELIHASLFSKER